MDSFCASWTEQAMKEAGFHVPDSFDLLPEMINKVRAELLNGRSLSCCFARCATARSTPPWSRLVRSWSSTRARPPRLAQGSFCGSLNGLAFVFLLRVLFLTLSFFFHRAMV